MKYSLLSICLCLMVFFGSCADKQTSPPSSLQPGVWRATLTLNDSVSLPFNFLVEADVDQPMLSIINGGDTIVVDELTIKGDSMVIALPVYHAEIRARLSDSLWTGRFHNYYRGTDYTIPFQAVYGQTYRFVTNEASAATDISGRWEVWFGEGVDSDQAIGLFTQNGSVIGGTFLTPYGDYRFLEGTVRGDSLYLSAFDGMYVMYFVAAIGDTLSGMYYSGNHYATTWTAWRNDTLQLPDAYRMASAASPFTVNMPEVSALLSTRKPTIIQLLGTWCPNCKDEARLLEALAQRYGDQLQVVGLSFERTTDSLQAATNIARTVDYLSLTYPVYFAGKADKEAIANALPQLEDFSAYPTTLFLYGDETVAAVHTGFSGPATGDGYAATIAEYERLCEKLIAY